MTRIDQNRISEIVRTLSSGRIDTPRKSANEAPTKSEVNPVRASKEDLRERLKSRLFKLREIEQDYEALAPELTVKEILLWEFGSLALAHAEFGFIAKSVTEAMMQNENVKQQLTKLIEEIYQHA